MAAFTGPTGSTSLISTASTRTPHRSVARLGKRDRRHVVFLHLEDPLLCVDDLDVNDRVDIRRRVVLRDDLLTRHFEHLRPEIDLDHDRERVDDVEPRLQDPLLGERPEEGHDPLLVRCDLVQRPAEDHEYDDDDQDR
jgi:hypothetical protein